MDITTLSVLQILSDSADLVLFLLSICHQTTLCKTCSVFACSL